jgi:hypothetical protein
MGLQYCQSVLKCVAACFVSPVTVLSIFVLY